MINLKQKNKKSFTEKEGENEYAFYMRQLQRNIVYCHQKYKAKRKRTLSQTKQAPKVYKSTKQTAIQFQQIKGQYINEVSKKETNGIQLYHLIEELRKIQNDNLKQLNGLKIRTELDQKLKTFNRQIDEKKLKSKQTSKKQKQTKSYKRYFQQRENQINLAFSYTFKGNIPPLYSTFNNLENYNIVNSKTQLKTKYIPLIQNILF